MHVQGLVIILIATCLTLSSQVTRAAGCRLGAAQCDGRRVVRPEGWDVGRFVSGPPGRSSSLQLANAECAAEVTATAYPQNRRGAFLVPMYSLQGDALTTRFQDSVVDSALGFWLDGRLFCVRLEVTFRHLDSKTGLGGVSGKTHFDFYDDDADTRFETFEQLGLRPRLPHWACSGKS
jgi:hypothetical protein